MEAATITLAIAHTWDDGSIDYITILGGNKAQFVDGGLAPRWLQERAAMVRIFDIGEGGEIGKRFSNNIMCVWINQEEYEQLLDLTKGKTNEDQEGING
jgi:hypothetical protein